MQLLDHRLTRTNAQKDLIDLLQSWIDEDDEGEQRETGEYLIKALDEDRLPNRKLFPQNLKDVTW